ncbi:YceI family protein [Arthrobacter sp. NPDC090010]|uniref:YceI family protein n=1 Tax=Arthrobacter sp. NPDC090010 TaxID=3363942 RepID=UPI00381D60EE
MPAARKKWLFAALIAALLGVTAVVVGPWLYAKSQPPAPAPLSVEDAAETGNATTAPNDSLPATQDGLWKVNSGSQAGYRFKEVLNSAEVTVVGRTPKVTGELNVQGGALRGATITVDVASITTDSANRDGYFRSTSMRTEQFPTASFTLNKPVTLPALGTSPVSVRAQGSLELAGRSKEVTAELQLVKAGGTVSASGSIPVAASDYGITAPDLGFVTVENDGLVEFLLKLDR